MAGRADRILQILERSGGRLQVREILTQLVAMEGAKAGDLVSATVSSTVAVDNRIRAARGETRRFRTYGDGDEEHGFISLMPAVQPARSIGQVMKSPEREIPTLIQQANVALREQVKAAVAKLSWQQFESNFLTQVLEALGFEDVEVTQPTRDGGKDALCTYKRGLVKSQAIVSAKHWGAQSVGPGEVQRLRGIKGAADTAIIVTSSRFSDDAIREAEPSQNQRAVVLIDGDWIVEACIRSSVGVEKVDLPDLFKLGGPLVPDGQ